MKVLAICLALVAASSASFVSEEDPTVVLVGNAIDNLIKEALEYVRKQLKTHEPLKVPDIPQQNINDDQTKVYLTADFSNVLVSKASDFVVNHIENNLVKFWAKFGVTIPSLHAEGDYNINGNAVDHKVSGKGTFSFDVTNLVASGFIQMEIVDHAMHMKDLKLNYTIDNVNFTEKGLSVEGMTDKQLQEIFNTQLLTFFKDNEQMVCDRVARQVMIEGNDIMKGKTLQELLDWLKDFISH